MQHASTRSLSAKPEEQMLERFFGRTDIFVDKTFANPF
jgi:hypothetical protein